MHGLGHSVCIDATHTVVAVGFFVVVVVLRRFFFFFKAGMTGMILKTKSLVLFFLCQSRITSEKFIFSSWPITSLPLAFRFLLLIFLFVL